MSNVNTADEKILEEVRILFKESLDICKNSTEKVLLETKLARLFMVLKSENLLESIDDELSKTIVGEEKTRIAIFLSLCCIFVKLEQVNTLVNSESSSGKSYICKQVYNLFPERLKFYRTRITPKVLTYWKPDKDPDWTWDGKILFLEDVSNGVLNSEVLKLMCSEGSKATVLINQIAIDIEIKGKPSLLITTASATPNNEMLNRFNLIPLNETEEQTHLIMQKQAKDASMGRENVKNEDIPNALSLLKRVEVTIPYAELLVDYFPISRVGMRRDFQRLLNLIKSVTALHQYQREKNEKGEIIASKEDYEITRSLIAKFGSGTISLTVNLRKAYQFCKEMQSESEFENFTATEIHSKHPFVTQKTWYNYLDKLTTLGFLKSNWDERPDVHQPVRTYKLETNLQEIILPPFGELKNEQKLQPIQKV